MNKATCAKLTEYLQAAQDGRYEIDRITKMLYPGLTIQEAYEIQRQLLRRRCAQGRGRGERAY